MAAILHLAEKQGESSQQGGWQKHMARRRYQRGTVRKRGKRQPVWELQWREDCITLEGKIGRRWRSCQLGPVAEMTYRQALKLADAHLNALNQGRVMPQSTITLERFVERNFIPDALPALKASTQRLYRSLLTVHLLPAFGHYRLSDITHLDLQRFVLLKMRQGLGWERANQLRQLASKLMATASKWGLLAGENPARGIELPEKTWVRVKHALSLIQVNQLLAILNEPVRTLAETAVLTGMRIGEILALRWQDVDFNLCHMRIERAYCRGVMGTPKTKSSRRTIPIPPSLCQALIQLRPSEPKSEALILLS